MKDFGEILSESVGESKKEYRYVRKMFDIEKIMEMSKEERETLFSLMRACENYNIREHIITMMKTKGIIIAVPEDL